MGISIWIPRMRHINSLQRPLEGNGLPGSQILPYMLLLASVLSQVATLAFGAIGPVATVHIANKNIAPDGFTRSLVYSFESTDVF